MQYSKAGVSADGEKRGLWWKAPRDFQRCSAQPDICKTTTLWLYPELDVFSSSQIAEGINQWLLILDYDANCVLGSSKWLLLTVFPRLSYLLFFIFFLVFGFIFFSPRNACFPRIAYNNILRPTATCEYNFAPGWWDSPFDKHLCVLFSRLASKFLDSCFLTVTNRRLQYPQNGCPLGCFRALETGSSFPHHLLYPQVSHMAAISAYKVNCLQYGILFTYVRR